MTEAFETSVLDAFTLVQALPRLNGSLVFLSSVAARTSCPTIRHLGRQIGTGRIRSRLGTDLAPKVRVNVVIHSHSNGNGACDGGRR